MTEVENIFAVFDVPFGITSETADITEEEIEQEYKPRDYREKAFEDIICEILDSQGHLYERQKRVANGVIDIITWHQCPDIIEVKRAGTPQYLIQAIVQLRFYAACFRRSTMWISVPGGIPQEHLHLLKEFGVKELKVIKNEDGSWGFDL